MRIGEERERRQREASVLERLPRGLEELHTHLATCVATYTEAFGAESAEIQFADGHIRVTVRGEKDGKWEPRAKIEISSVSNPPSFRVEREEGTQSIEVGVLPGNKLFYREGEEYLTMEELTRRILDRAFFPKLVE